MQLCRNNPHPARGRKPPVPLKCAVFCRNNPHPARGRKQCPRKYSIFRLWETTHTPQGDGNALLFTCFPVSQETTHTPQGDGNATPCAYSLHSLKQSTPRKGTETTVYIQPDFLPLVKQPTPRKGTETLHVLFYTHGLPETTHTPQGDGNC